LKDDIPQSVHITFGSTSIYLQEFKSSLTSKVLAVIVMSSL